MPENQVCLKSHPTFTEKKRPWEDLETFDVPPIFAMMMNNVGSRFRRSFHTSDEVFRYRWSDLRRTARMRFDSISISVLQTPSLTSIITRVCMWVLSSEYVCV